MQRRRIVEVSGTLQSVSESREYDRETLFKSQTNPLSTSTSCGDARGPAAHDDSLSAPSLSIAATDAIQEEGNTFVFTVTRGGDVSGTILWYENGAAAQLLLSTGAFDVVTLGQARMVMLTPIAVGITFILGFKALSPSVRRVGFPAAFGLLVLVFLLWAVSFAEQVHQYGKDAAQTFSLQAEAWDNASLDFPEGDRAGHGWAGLLFGCLVVMMPLTTFIGHTGLEHYLNRFERRGPNPDCVRALEDVHVYEGLTARIDKEVTAAARKVSACDLSTLSQHWQSLRRYDDQYHVWTRARPCLLRVKQLAAHLHHAARRLKPLGCAWRLYELREAILG